MSEHTDQRGEGEVGWSATEGLGLFVELADRVGTAVLVEALDRTVLVDNRTFRTQFPTDGLGPALEPFTRLTLDPDAVRDRVDRMIAEGVDVVGEEIALADGRVVAMDFLASRAGGRLVAHVWQLRDVTERRRLDDARARAEESLARRESQLRQLVDANPLGIFFSDFSGVVTDANDAFLRIVGYSRAELEAGDLNWKTITPPDRMAASERAEAEARARGVYEPFEKEYVRKDGARVPVLVGGVVFEETRETGYGIDFVLDLSERERAEAALRESELRYRSMFESDLTGNYVSTPDGRLLACNDAFARIFGFDSVSHALASELTSIYRRPDERGEFIELLRRERRLTRYEFEVKRFDGRALHTVDFVEGVFDGDDQLVEIRGSCFDDTGRKELERQLLQSQKLEAVGRLAGGIAHDFNNLLTVIGGYSDLLVNRIGSEDPLHEGAVEIRAAAGRAADLTGQLLAFSRNQILRPRVLDLNALVKNLERILRRLIGEHIEFVTDLGAGLPNVEADPGQLEQVVTNLVVNARDAMAGGGRLTITTSTTTAPHAVVLSVRDTGHGMDEETRSHIFEPFYTTKEQGKGTGLGLATVYGIVRQSRGTLEVDSEPGRGATFRVCLPAVEAAVEPSGSRPAPEPEHAKGETVLLVEDDPSVRRLASTALRRYGYTVLEATSGPEALELSARHEGTIHIIVSDVVMPRMDGPTLVGRMRAERPDIRVLFVSGYTADHLLGSDVSDGRAAFLAKPFTPIDLAKQVRRALDGTA